MNQQDLRSQFLDTLTHIGSVLTKATQNSGPNQILAAPDLHKIAEGLFLSAWTHWEQFTHYILVEDVATAPTSRLRREIRGFRTKRAAWRLSDRLLSHPDHPSKFVEWSDYATVVSRADEFLGPGNRFSAAPLPRQNDFSLLKRVRNAVAHRSDKAWDSFISLCRAAPFSIPPNKMRGITPGRFLVTHQWNGQTVLSESLFLLEQSATHLVP